MFFVIIFTLYIHHHLQFVKHTMLMVDDTLYKLPSLLLLLNCSHIFSTSTPTKRRTVPQTNTSMKNDMISSKCVFIRKNLNLLLQRLLWEEKLPGNRVQLHKSDVGMKAHSSICVSGVQLLQQAVEVLQHRVQNLQGVVHVFKVCWIN